MTSQDRIALTIGSDEWKRMVTSGANALGVDVPDVRMVQLVRFAQTLMEWNRRINLTAITDPRQVATKHFVDSIAALNHIPETGSLLDIGSGGGFPGLVIAIFRPALQITSADSVRKKISFQNHLIRTLGLTSSRALHTRAEILAEESNRYDVIVSRALGSLEMFTTLALPMLSKTGKIIAYKGGLDEDGEEEVDALKARHPDLTVDTLGYILPSSGDRRSLVFITQRQDG